MQVRLQLMYPSMRSPFKSTAQPLRLGRTSSSPTPSMTPMAQLASLIPAAITSRTSLTNSRTSRLRTQLPSWTDPTNGNFIRFGFSENVAHFSDYDAATKSVAGNIFDPNRIKDAITINVDGRNLNPADYSLEPDGKPWLIRINLVNQSLRIYEGQTVTLPTTNH